MSNTLNRLSQPRPSSSAIGIAPTKGVSAAAPAARQTSPASSTTDGSALSREVGLSDAKTERSGQTLSAQFLAANKPSNGNGNASTSAIGWSNKPPQANSSHKFAPEGFTDNIDDVVGLPDSPAESDDIHVAPPEGEKPVSVEDDRNNTTVSTYEDGTTVVEGNRDGQDYQTTTVQGENGASTSTTTYVKDGKEYTNTVKTTADGVVTEVYDVATGEVIERTERVTQQVEGDPYSLHPGSPEVVNHVDFDDADPSTVVDTRQSVVDNSSNPPEVRLVSESQSVSTRIPGDYPDSGSDFDLDPTGVTPPESVELDRDITVDQDQSGTYITTEHTQVYDENGKRVVNSQTSGVEQRLVGTDANGVEVYASEGAVTTQHEDKPGETSYVSERRGVYRADQVFDEYGAPIGDYPQFQDALDPNGDNGYVDVRHTAAYTPDGVVWATEYGEYADPTANGQTVTAISAPGGEKITLRDVSENGQAVDTQSVYPGSQVTDISHERYNDDGSYSIDSVTKNGDEVLAEVTRTGEVVEPGEINGDIEQDAVDLFLAGVEGDIVEESSIVTVYKDGKPVTEESTSYRASGSQANLQVSEGPAGSVTAASSDGTDLYAVDDKGNKITRDSDGKISVDGKPVVGNAQNPFELPSSSGNAVSAASTAGDIIEGLQESGFIKGDWADGFKTRAGALGATFALAGVAANVVDGDVLGVLDTLAGGADDLIGGAELVGASSAALKTAGKYAGALNFALAAGDAINGEWEDAALKTGTGVGLILAASSNPVTAAIGGALIIGISIYEIGKLISASGEPQEVAPLEI